MSSATANIFPENIGLADNGKAALVGNKHLLWRYVENIGLYCEKVILLYWRLSDIIFVAEPAIYTHTHRLRNYPT